MTSPTSPQRKRLLTKENVIPDETLHSTSDTGLASGVSRPPIICSGGHLLKNEWPRTCETLHDTSEGDRTSKVLKPPILFPGRHLSMNGHARPYKIQSRFPFLDFTLKGRGPRTNAKRPSELPMRLSPSSHSSFAPNTRNHSFVHSSTPPIPVMTKQTTAIANDLQQLPIDSNLTEPDRLLLNYLLDESDGRNDLIQRLEELNNDQSRNFEPTVFLLWDFKDFPKGTFFRRLLDVYVSCVSGAARHPTDVVFVTHLILYFATSVPSAIYLFHSFTLAHGILHTIMTIYYFGTYTLMRHNHIHGNGILSRSHRYFDTTFPYLLDPLMGHTWNSYYYHHVKHHHVEGNGPGDLSSTIRLQRDEWSSLAYYVSRFALLVWLDLPLYFVRTGKPQMAFRAASWEFLSYTLLILATRLHFRAAIFVLIIPFALVRLGLMIGNFGQHAFVDELEPDSDYRSSITLIDVSSNRFCFNDGYHTAHHLNPRRHWRDQPLSLLKGKTEYEQGRALVFRNIDYLGITFRLMLKDYNYLARCLVPISEEQRNMTHLEIMEMLRTKTKRFTEEDIERLWGNKKKQ